MPDLTQPIRTARLNLVLMTPAFFAASISGDQAQAAQVLGVPIPEQWWPVSAHQQNRLTQVRQNAALLPWMERAIVLRAPQTMVGSIAFHMAAAPEPVRPLGPGGVEFGYSIFPPFRRRGYATEACQAVMGWAQQQGATRFILSISPANQASLRVAAHCGFVKIGEQIDEDDGLEEIYVRLAGG